MLLTAGTEGQGHQAELFPCDMEEQGELTKERVGSGASSRTVSGSESSYSEPEAVAPLGAEARLLPPPSEHQIREARRAGQKASRIVLLRNLGFNYSSRRPPAS